jgi:hypothetical protein
MLDTPAVFIPIRTIKTWPPKRKAAHARLLALDSKV